MCVYGGDLSDSHYIEVIGYTDLHVWSVIRWRNWSLYISVGIYVNYFLSVLICVVICTYINVCIKCVCVCVHPLGTCASVLAEHKNIGSWRCNSLISTGLLDL